MTFANKGLDMLKDDGKMIIVHPSTWCINIKQMDKGGDVGEYKRRINGHVRKIILDNMGKLFNVGLYVPCSIDYIDFSKKYDEIEFINCGDEQKVKSLNDCNLVGDYSIIKSILDKVAKYPNKFKDHIYVPGKSKVDENTYYIKSCKMLGSSDLIEAGGDKRGGGYKYDTSYQSTYIKINNSFAQYRLGLYKFLYAKETQSFGGGPLTNGISSTPHKALDSVKKFTNKEADNLFDTKEHLENWKYNVFHIKLPIFLSIVFTFNSSNNFADIMPWLVDKQYTDDEINTLFNFIDEEIKFIDYVLKKYERRSLWNKRYITGDINIDNKDVKKSLE